MSVVRRRRSGRERIVRVCVVRKEVIMPEPHPISSRRGVGEEVGKWRERKEVWGGEERVSKRR